MSLTNIELYEALKKDVSEESARMIAEALSPAGSLAAKVDHIGVELERLSAAVSANGAKIESLERRMHDRFSSFERRFITVFAVPLWGAVAAGLVKLFVG